MPDRTYIDKEQTPKMEKLKGDNNIRQILPGDKERYGYVPIIILYGRIFLRAKKNNT